MTRTRKISPGIANIIIWAGVILGVSMTFANTAVAYKESLPLMLFVGWFMTNQILTGNRQSLKQEWTCIRRMLGRN